MRIAYRVMLAAAPLSLLALAACSDRATSTSSTHNAISASDPTGDGKAWDVAQNWGEVADSDKDEAVNEAFAAIAKQMGSYNAEAGNAMNSVTSTTDFGSAVTAAQSTLKDKEMLIASHGLTLGDFVPSAVMITVGFSGNGNFYIGGAAQGVVCFVLMPVKDTWMMAGDPTVYSQWSYKANVSFLAGASLGTGVGGGAGWAVGAGAVWGTLPDISDLQGPMVGIWGTGTVGIGLEADLFLLQHASDPTNISLSGGKTNILAYGMWTVGAEAGFAIHISGGVAFNLPEVLDAFGLENNTLMGLLHTASGADAAAPSSSPPSTPTSGGSQPTTSADAGPSTPAPSGDNDASADAPAAPSADDAGPSTPAPSADCSQAADGSYCGNDGVTGDANTLYTCASSALTATTPCANGCNAVGSGADACN